VGGKARIAALASVAIATVACSRQSAQPAAQEQRAEAAQSAVKPAPARLPEDPLAGKQSEQQWRQHMVHEEDERQMQFDLQREEQHRGLRKLIAASRARYDQARSEAALAKVRAEMPRKLADIEKQVKQLDPWGNNSRLLPDYAALSAALAGPYPDAKLAALHGDAHALDSLRADFDQRLQKIDAWLERAEKEEGEEGEGEAERGER
jgi:hypothetical protein